ncbi:hypothetical protein HKD37_08G023053 [Glycine soja]
MEQPDIDGLNIEDEVDMEFNIPESGESEIDLSLFLVEGIAIDELNPTLFIFSFYHKVDVQQVLNGGPWHFEALGTRNTCGDAKTWWKWRVTVAPRGR